MSITHREAASEPGVPVSRGPEGVEQQLRQRTSTGALDPLLPHGKNHRVVGRKFLPDGPNWR